MKTIRMLAVAILVGLQGCVVPAALNTLERFKSYSVVMAQPIDADHFRVVVAVDHQRGAFNPLGGHGSGYVTSRIAVELWHLSVTDLGIAARKEDTLSFDSEEEMATWRARKTVQLDMARGRISLAPPAQPRRAGQACAARLPPARPQRNASREVVVSEGGDAIMVVDHIGQARQAVVLNPCDASAPSHVVEFPMERTFGFSTHADGSPRLIRGRKEDASHAGQRWRYEVQMYPGPKRLTFSEKDLGVQDKGWLVHQNFMFDEQTRRFHWIVLPADDDAEFGLITHDFANGKTTRRAFSLARS